MTCLWQWFSVKRFVYNRLWSAWSSKNNLLEYNTLFACIKSKWSSFAWNFYFPSMYNNCPDQGNLFLIFWFNLHDARCFNTVTERTCFASQNWTDRSNKSISNPPPTTTETGWLVVIPNVFSHLCTKDVEGSMHIQSNSFIYTWKWTINLLNH